jgi:hypothetical protein
VEICAELGERAKLARKRSVVPSRDTTNSWKTQPRYERRLTAVQRNDEDVEWQEPRRRNYGRRYQALPGMRRDH